VRSGTPAHIARRWCLVGVSDEMPSKFFDDITRPLDYRWRR
jgi:hypothetical protein